MLAETVFASLAKEASSKAAIGCFSTCGLRFSSNQPRPVPSGSRLLWASRLSGASSSQKLALVGSLPALMPNRRHIERQPSCLDPPAAGPSAQAVHPTQLLDRVVIAAEGVADLAAQQLGLEAFAQQLAGDRVDSLGLRPGAGADDPVEPPAAEQQPDAVVQRPAARQRALAQAPEPDRQALGLSVGVDGQRALQQPEALERLGRPAGAGQRRPGTSTWRPRSGRPARSPAATPRRACRRARAPARSPAGCASSRRPRRGCPGRAPAPRSGRLVSRRRNSDRCSATQVRPVKRALKALICGVVSPEAVGRKRIRGSFTRASERT